MRRKAKVDSNQPEIVEAFRKLGYSVLLLHQVGSGCPDICVGKHGYNYLVEIKDGKKSPSQRELTPQEKDFHDSWRGHVMIINSVQDVVHFEERLKE
jgi:Holliday junction resolvase